MSERSMVGRVIGTYRLAEALGDGGPGAVYRAVDAASGREAAFRVFARAVSGDAMLADRLRAIAPALKKLQHPNIAAFYELVSVGADLALFLEYVPGSTLDAVRQQAGRLETNVAVSCAVQMLRALEFAHSRGVLHHALRPSNVMVTRHGTAKVLDFGIGHAFGANRKTREDRLLIVLAYLAPEQIQNQPGDARSDLYSVGVVLYELLTGRLPFGHRSEFALRQAHLSEPPASPRFMVPDLPEWLDQAVLRALAKHPTSRYQNATEFRAVLEAALGLSTSREAAIIRQRPGAAAESFAAAPPIPGPAAPGGRSSGPHSALPASTPAPSGEPTILPVAVPLKADAGRPGAAGGRISGPHATFPPPAPGPAAPAAAGGRASGSHAAAPSAALPSADADGRSPAAVPAPMRADARAPRSGVGGAIGVLLLVACLVAAGMYLWKRFHAPAETPRQAPLEQAARVPAPAATARVTAAPPTAEPARGPVAAVPASAPAPAVPAPRPKPVAKPPLASKPLPSAINAQPFSASRPPGAAAAPAAEAAGPRDMSFHKIKLVAREGDAGRAVDVVIMLGEARLTVTPDGGGAALRSVRYADITGASYSRTEKRTLGLISSAQHLLTIETGSGPLWLRLDKDGAEAVLKAFETRTGRVVTR